MTHLLRRSYREGGKVKNETVGNISYLPEKLVEVVRAGLRGKPVGVLSAEIVIERSLPAGHVLAALAMARRLALARLLDRNRSRERDLCIAMILACALAPASDPAMLAAPRQSSLAEALGLANADAEDLDGAMDWLVDRQARIEARLARRHLASRGLALHAVSPWRCEDRCRGLAELRCSRPLEGGAWRIACGVLYDRPGRPLAVEVLSGAQREGTALASRIAELTTRLGLSRVVVCDRAMLTSAERELLRADESAGRITSLTKLEIRRLATEGVLQASLFDGQDLYELAVAAYPDERLVACRDSSLAVQRACEREELIAEADDSEPALDGIHVLRTTVGESELAAAEVIDSYRQVARARGCCEHSRLALRPQPHALGSRLGAHAFLCMLARYLTWHLHRVWEPLLLRGERVHNYRMLLIELASLTRNTIRLAGDSSTFEQLSQPTPFQARALELAEHAPLPA